MRDDKQYKKLCQTLFDKDNLHIEYHFRCFDCKVNMMFLTRTKAVKMYLEHGHKKMEIIQITNNKVKKHRKRDINYWKQYMEDEGI